MPNMMQDTPKMWIEEDDFQDQFDAENQALVVAEEQPQLPTIKEQTEMVEKSDISEKNKSMLGQLIEISKVSQLLKNINNEEVAAERNNLLDATCAVFIQSRMQNNMQMETLKTKVIQRLIDNIDNMDLELANEVLTNISQVTSTDATNAMSNLKGNGLASTTLPGGTTVNLNLATGEGSSVNNNTLNAQPQQVQQLKEVATLNSSIRAWQNIPGKKQPIQAQIVDNTNK